MFALVTSLGLMQLRISKIGNENEHEIGVGNGGGKEDFLPKEFEDCAERKAMHQKIQESRR
jgi:hypothetical protein